MLFKPQKTVGWLKGESIQLVREAKEAPTMKTLLCCFEILDLTDEINRPWEDHPQWFYGDKAAFQDLYTLSASLWLYNDPSRDRMFPYVNEIKRLIAWYNLLADRDRVR